MPADASIGTLPLGGELLNGLIVNIAKGETQSDNHPYTRMKLLLPSQFMPSDVTRCFTNKKKWVQSKNCTHLLSLAALIRV